ncbi:haloacid dehalogenase [Verticillium alfalfae VaMs.102]|uniref:Haloacid dehalogenase n=1 Tax=Verticillium alfalfae (strain VaMs.102 / ATCC MYA-4576 / FGSC 10136) TaxID=526221 RepID=C9S5C8_VERA1|nr:haloacid dehalogenase [Verticillium alfalfae VaMs.102]EEY14200.1 haloacid dehalogenase [Verticillium alfalfae VaMs.102]
MSSSSSPELIKTQVKAMTFDVFGTTVDWRSSVTDELTNRAASKSGKHPDEDRIANLRRLSRDDWGRFAQQWRTTYSTFVREFIPGETPWKDVDTHHYDALVDLLAEWQLEGIYSDEEVRELSLVWHRLRPWDEAARGLRLLGRHYVTSMLSNGNASLLRDLDDFGSLNFQRRLSGEDFKAYKPNPKVYLGAAQSLEMTEPGHVAMVAAHLDDLEGARKCGLRTVYVERPGEEAWKDDEDRYRNAKDWVDIWIGEKDGGFVELARRLGVEQ